MADWLSTLNIFVLEGRLRVFSLFFMCFNPRHRIKRDCLLRTEKEQLVTCGQMLSSTAHFRLKKVKVSGALGWWV